MKPYILITNDDGHEAKGIHVLTEIMAEIGNVVVVSPDGPRSGTSNAITINHPIRYKQINKTENVTWYTCNGTPTDCIKLAMNEVVERRPDLIVSGINHGSNAAINVIYSGTMGAVLEGCAYYIPSIGFSLCDHNSDADFTQFAPYVKKIALETIKNGLPNGVCLNVNAPFGKISGVKIVRQCRAFWTEEFEQRFDPSGKKYLWLTGVFHNHEPKAEDTDEWCMVNELVSIVPTKIDLTAHDLINTIKEWNI